jgi:hypothetical protein
MCRASLMAAAFVLVACGGQNVTSTSDAGQDAATETSVADAAMMATDAPEEGPSDSGEDASTACAGSAKNVCIADSGCDLSCPPTWSAALADRSMCVPSCGFQRELIADCGQYQQWQLAAGDCSVVYYYEKSTGMLVALFAYCAGDPRACQFGPSGFTEPTTCGAQVEVYPCDDGGADAGVAD